MCSEGFSEVDLPMEVNASGSVDSAAVEAAARWGGESSSRMSKIGKTSPL